MQTLGLNDDDDNEIPKKFWARQFQDQPTKPQKWFDWIFGVVLPTICIFFDPFVFSNHLGGGQPLLGAFKPFVYLLSFVSILMMAAWLLWREKLKGLSSLFTGVFALSALMSAVIGGVLFPFSLIGLFFLIGVLGFTPLFTTVIYLRNSVRASRVARLTLSHNPFVYSAVLASIFAFVIPYVANVEMARSLEHIKYGGAETIRAEGRMLRFVSPLVNTSTLRVEYVMMSWEMRETERGRALEEVYHNLTGEDIAKYRIPID